MNFDFNSLLIDGKFDIILMDPPWKIPQPKVKRGVSFTSFLISKILFEGHVELQSN
jgi:hypothetical protein